MGIYQSIYDLINTYIYGGEIIVGSYQEMTAIIISTIACVFMVALPFLIVKKIIDIIGG